MTTMAESKRIFPKHVPSSRHITWTLVTNTHSQAPSHLPNQPLEVQPVVCTELGGLCAQELHIRNLLFPVVGVFAP
jgi:hypothetical protein